MRRACVFFLLTIAGTAQDGPELVRLLQHRPDVRARGRLVRTSEDKAQHVHQITMVRKLLPQAANMLWTISDSPQILMEERFGGPVRIWLGSASVLAPRRWTEAVAESDFTLEDIAEAHFFWPKQTVIRKEPCGAHECLVLRSEPDENAATAYVEVQSWIDRTALLAVKMVKKPKSGAAKEIVARGLRQIGAEWGASTVEARTQGATAYTRLVFTSGSEKVRVTEQEVDPKVLFAGK